jgi:hypothetical protein
VKSNHDKSKEEQRASEVLSLVERFHTPASHDHEHRRESRTVGRMAVPTALQAVALVAFAHQLRAHKRPETTATRFRRGLRRAFVLRRR